MMVVTSREYQRVNDDEGAKRVVYKGGCHQFEWPIEIKLFANIVKSDLYFEVI